MVYKVDNYNYIQHTVDLVHQVDQDGVVDNQELHCLAVEVAYQDRVVDIEEHRMVDNYRVGNLLVAVHTVQHYYKVDKLLIDLLADLVEEAQQLEDNLIEDVDYRMLVEEYMYLVLVEEVVVVVVVAVVMLVMDMLVPMDHLVDGMLIQKQMVPDNLDHMMLVLLADEHMVMELVLEYMMLVLLLVLMLLVLVIKTMQLMMVLMMVGVVLELEDTVSNCLESFNILIKGTSKSSRENHGKIKTTILTNKKQTTLQQRNS